MSDIRKKLGALWEAVARVLATGNSLRYSNTATTCHPEERVVCAPKDLNFHAQRDSEIEILSLRMKRGASE
jgi:hypothetical protein